MGLDMYLTASKYIPGWAHYGDAEKARYRDVLTILGLDGFQCEGSPSATIELNVCYWRKANAIHKWFVDNVQGGVDECRTSDVSREQLEALVVACRVALDSIETVDGDVDTGTTYYPDGRVEHHTKPGKVVAQTAIAEKLMPTQGGFFFGGTKYDEYYLEDLKHTTETISKILVDSRFEWFEFQYHASW